MNSLSSLKICLISGFIIVGGCAEKNKKANVSKSVPQVVSEGSLIPAKKSPESSRFQLRAIEEINLENGLQIFVIRDKRLPRLSLSLMVKVGQRNESNDLTGLNHLTASMLETETRYRNALKLADDLAQLGTGISVDSDDDATYFSTNALTESANEILDLFHEVITAPAFSDNELRRTKSEIRSALKKRNDNPSTVASDQIYEMIYKDHPYAQTGSGNEKSLQKIKKATLIKHYLAWYRPNNSILSVVGNFDDQFVEKIKEKFGTWSPKEIKAKAPEQFESVKKLRLRIVTKPQIKQAQIRFAQFGIDRRSPDFLKLRLANEVLGAGFSSRLNQRVRDDLGLTYSISSSYKTGFDQGLFMISTFTKNETAEKTVTEVLNVVRKFVDEGVLDQELKAAKNQLLGQLPRSLETAESLAQTIMLFDYYGVPRSYLAQFKENVEKITKQDLNEVIKKYMHPDNFEVVVYGDEKALASQFKAYNPERVRR